jgi:nicotinamidase-related amidase
MALVGATPRNAWQADAGRIVLARRRAAGRELTVVASPSPVVLDLSRMACIIVDMQNDFCAAGGWLAHIGVDIVPARAAIDPLERLLPTLRNADVPIIWLNWGNRPDRANLPPGVIHVYDPDGESVGIGDPLPGSGSHVLEKGSWSAGIVDGLTVDDRDIHVDKYRMSGFFDTELDSVLRHLDVTSLLFGGVNVDQCVLATLSDAACLGYDVVVLRDCSGTTSPAYCAEATYYNVAQCFGFVADGADILDALGSGVAK